MKKKNVCPRIKSIIFNEFKYTYDPYYNILGTHLLGINNGRTLRIPYIETSSFDTFSFVTCDCEGPLGLPYYDLDSTTDLNTKIAIKNTEEYCQRGYEDASYFYHETLNLNF